MQHSLRLQDQGARWNDNSKMRARLQRELKGLQISSGKVDQRQAEKCNLLTLELRKVWHKRGMAAFEQF